MFYTLGYIKNTLCKKDRQENFWGILQNVDNLEDIKKDIEEQHGPCTFKLYTNQNFVFSPIL